nr:MAG TPA: hypothetical protein [Caudoviricetes sp.]
MNVLFINQPQNTNDKSYISYMGLSLSTGSFSFYKTS